MNTMLIPQSLVLLVAVGLSVAVAVLAFERRPAWGATCLVWTMLSVAVWAAGDALALLLARGSLPWLDAARFLGAAALPLAWYGLVAAYVSDGKRPTSMALIRLGTVPLLTVLLAASNSHHGSLGGAVEAGAVGLWSWVHAAYGVALAAAGWLALGLCARETEGSPAEPVWILAIVGALILSATVVGPWLRLAWGMPAMHVALAGSGALLLGGLYRHRTVDLLPLVEQALEDQEANAVLALDPHGRVVDANAPALLLLAEHGVWEAVGRRASHVFTGPLAPLAVGGDGAVTLAADGGQRLIRSRELPLGHGEGSWYGRALVLREETADVACRS